MNRRTLLKNLALATTAAMLVPACVADTKKLSIALNNLDVDGEDETLLAALASTIIPNTDKPGGFETGTHLYAFIMVDDCFDADGKKKFMEGLRAFRKEVKAIGGNDFDDLTDAERFETLVKVERSSALSEQAKSFYNTTKRLIIDGYTQSQYYLTEVKPYELVPGPNFRGCVDVPVKNV